jgi:hypothetical protein
MLSNVASHYAHKAGVSENKNVSLLDISQSKVGNAFAAYNTRSGQYSIAVDKVTGKINSLAGNKYNMENAFVHEKVHEINPKSRSAFGETIAILTQANHSSFLDASSGFQTSIGVYAATKLNEALSTEEIGSKQVVKTLADLNSSILGMFVSYMYDQNSKSVKHHLLMPEIKVSVPKK